MSVYVDAVDGQVPERQRQGCPWSDSVVVRVEVVCLCRRCRWTSRRVAVPVRLRSVPARRCAQLRPYRRRPSPPRRSLRRPVRRISHVEWTLRRRRRRASRGRCVALPSRRTPTGVRSTSMHRPPPPPSPSGSVRPCVRFIVTLPSPP